MAVVNEVVTKFSFTGSTAPLGKFNKGLASSVKRLGALAAATGVVIGGFRLWANSVLKTIDPIAQLNRETGVSVKAIQALSFAASVNGGSAEGMRASLKKLGSVIGEASIGLGLGKVIFEEYGLSVFDASGKVKDAGTIFEELRQKVVELDLDLAQVQGIAKKLGLDPATVQLLTKTNEQMAELSAESERLGELTTAQVNAAADYNDSLTRLGKSMGFVKSLVAVGLAPAMKDLNLGFTSFIEKNRDQIVKVATATVNIFLKLGEAIGRLIRFITGIISFIVKLVKSSTALQVALLAVAGILAIMFFPLIKGKLILSAVFLIFDDLITLFEGGDSVIGRLFGGLVDYLTIAKEFLADIFNTIKGIFTFDLGVIGGLLSGGLSAVSGLFSVSQPTAGATSNTTNNRSVSQDVQVNITATDPIATGRAVTDNLQKQMNDANAQVGNGGL